jgi:beta-lactam-binding protein with PASTA domain
MTDSVSRAADRVTVPNVVGLTFASGREVAYDAGVTLANPDPDGPPIGALAWPGVFVITSQEPAQGASLHRHDSLLVWLGSDQDFVNVRTNGPRPLPSLTGEAEPPSDMLFPSEVTELPTSIAEGQAR